MSQDSEAKDSNHLTDKFINTILTSSFKTQQCVKQQFQVIKVLNERVSDLEKKITKTQKVAINETTNSLPIDDKPEALEITLTPSNNKLESNVNKNIPPTSDSTAEPTTESSSAVEDEIQPSICTCPETAIPSEVISNIRPDIDEEFKDSEESKKDVYLRNVEGTDSVEISPMRDFVNAGVTQDNKHEINVYNPAQVQDMSSAFGNFSSEFTKHLMVSIQPMLQEKKMQENTKTNQVPPIQVD